MIRNKSELLVVWVPGDRPNRRMDIVPHSSQHSPRSEICILLHECGRVCSKTTCGYRQPKNIQYAAPSLLCMDDTKVNTAVCNAIWQVNANSTYVMILRAGGDGYNIRGYYAYDGSLGNAIRDT